MVKLIEWRRNPEVNTGMRPGDVVSQIEPYFGRDDAFISMIDIPKVGIPPRTGHHGTPTGIYTYPLSEPEIINQFSSDRLPYKSYSPYVAVILSKPNDKWFTNETSKGECAAIDEKLDQMMHSYLGEDQWEKAKHAALKNVWRVEIPASYTYNNIWMAAALISRRETAKTAGTGSQWGLLRPEDYYKSMSMRDARRPMVWNTLFRKLGYDVVADYGSKMIYDIEPHQVCFLTKGAISNYEIFRNGRKGSFGHQKAMLESGPQLFRLIRRNAISMGAAFAIMDCIITKDEGIRYPSSADDIGISMVNPNIRLVPSQVAETIAHMSEQDEYEVLRLLNKYPAVKSYAGL